MSAADVRLVSARRLIASPVDAVFALAPGDRPLVSAGDSVVLGAPIAERLRDPRLDEMEIPAGGHGGARRAVGRPAPTRRRAGAGRRVRLRLARPLAGRDRRHGRRDRIAVRRDRPFGPAGDRHHDPGRRPRHPRGRRPRRADARPPPGRRRGRAALGRARCRLGGHDPRRRLAGRCGDADPRPGDGRLRRGRGRVVEQGTARLHRLGGTPAGGPPPASAVRGAGPRRGHATAAGRCGPGRPRRRWPDARWRSSPTRRRWSSTCRT